MENEPDRTWSRNMRELIQEMIHCRNMQGNNEKLDEDMISTFEKRYKEILQTAKKEYEYMEAHLLFLHDNKVPATNNEAERLLRSYKRKQQQAVTFRRFESIEFLCKCMSMLIKIRQKEETNVFNRVSQIFG